MAQLTITPRLYVNGQVVPWPAAVVCPFHFTSTTTTYQHDGRDASGGGNTWDWEYYLLEALPHNNADTVRWTFKWFQWNWKRTITYASRPDSPYIESGTFKADGQDRNPYGHTAGPAPGAEWADMLMSGTYHQYSRGGELYMTQVNEVSNVYAVLEAWTRTPTGHLVRDADSGHLVKANGHLVFDGGNI